MIVIGYQGIGKSTLAGRDHKFIDLDPETSGLMVNVQMIGINLIVKSLSIYLNRVILCLLQVMRLLETN